MTTNMFRKSHYIWLAQTCRDMIQLHYPPNREAVASAIRIMADTLESESPSRFNKTLFLHNIFCDPTDHKPTDCPGIETEVH